MIVQFHDGSAITVSDVRGQAIKQAMRAGVEFVDIDDDMYRVSGIKAVRSANVEQSPRYQVKQLAPPTTELSEEQREANLRRIREMKQAFMGRM